MFPPRGRLGHTLCSASVIALACGGDPTELLPEAFFARPAQRAAAKDPATAAVTMVPGKKFSKKEDQRAEY